MWVLSLLLLELASSGVIGGSHCMAETLKCGRLRPPLHTHKNLFVSATQIEYMCRQQDRFFKCLDQMVNSRVAGVTSLPTQLQRARTLIRDLGLHTSPWQKKYLELAPCINRQYTEFCTNPEFLGTIRLGDRDRSKCSLREEAVKCISATLSLNCGIEAGKLFYHLLRMTSDGDKNCYSVGSEILFFPTLQEVTEGEKKEAYSDVYRRLEKRIGSILEETMENSLPVSEDLKDNDFFLKRTGVSPSMESSTETPAPEQTTINLPVLDETAYLSQENRRGLFRTLRVLNSKYDAVRFLSNDSVSTYSKYPGFNILDYVSCDKKTYKGRPIMWCYYGLRYKDSCCHEGERGSYDTDAPIIPEEIDPQLGNRLYAMLPLSYTFGDYNQVLRWLGRRIIEIKGLPTPEALTTPYLHELFTNYSDCEEQQIPSSSSAEHLTTDDVASYTSGTIQITPAEAETEGIVYVPVPPPGEVDENIFGTKQLTERQLAMLEEAHWIRAQQTAIVPNEPPEGDDYLFKAFAIIIINRAENSNLTKIICGRVNECHQNASYIFKCSYFFQSENEESPAEDSTEGTSIGESSSSEQVGILSNEHQSQVVKRSGFMEGAVHVITFNDSHGHPLHLPVTHDASESIGLDLEDSTEMPDGMQSETVQFVLIEPDMINRMTYVDSDRSLKITADPSMDNEHVNLDDYSTENENILLEFEENDVRESVPQYSLVLEPLGDLENFVADVVDNIPVE